jgi:hypothetical protein
MFCDLVGSTALSGKLDPEKMREVIRAYQDACSGPVARYDGFIAKFMGDGVLAYFGFPRAHEDDAERAVRAGLDIAAAVGRLHAPEPLKVRVGIATGLVVVGDLIGEGTSQEHRRDRLTSRRPSPSLLPTRAAVLYPTRHRGASPGTFGDPAGSIRASSSRRSRAACASAGLRARATRSARARVFHVTITVIVHCGTIRRVGAFSSRNVTRIMRSIGVRENAFF